MNFILILLGKLIFFVSRVLNLGSGSTWPGHVAMEANSAFLKQVLNKNPNLKTILIAGTNGKTTTAKLLKLMLEQNGLKVFQNESGANLINGMASSVIQHSSLHGKLNFDVAIFEVDENNLKFAIIQTNPSSILLLNIFRDQLDRYGEVNKVLQDWENALLSADRYTLLITNGDDPALSFLAKNSKLKFLLFGVSEKLMTRKNIEHDVDFIHCPSCQSRLVYKKISYSHMGNFSCSTCGFKKESVSKVNIKSHPLHGKYNIYNTNAAALLANKVFNISEKIINTSLKNFKPAFGRQETLSYKGGEVVIYLSKNPSGFNQSIDALNEKGNKGPLLIVINDRIPDGRDISWIWDVDFENLPKNSKIFISGDRAYEMALRLKYSNSEFKFNTFSKIATAIDSAIAESKTGETLTIFPTYSAMLEARKILTGKKIL